MLYQAKVNSGGLNVRKSASKSATSITQLKRNTVVDVFEDDGTWLRIQQGSVSGWVMKQYTIKIETENTPLENEAENAPSGNLEEIVADLAKRVSVLENQMKLMEGD